ncbi:MAG: hypothetical protein GY856_54775 [bacterium]|nr:hypothetical protein [bacterium]
MLSQEARARAVEDEQKAFDALLPALLLEHRGEFVILRGGRVVAFHPTHDAAYEDALKRFGLEEAFLISEVAEQPHASLSISWEAGVLFA